MKLSVDEFEALVAEAMDRIPPAFNRYLEGVTIDIEPEPDPDTCRKMKLRSKRELLGLYHGRPITERSVNDMVRWPDSITIYQRNIERTCRTKREIRQQVITTVLHEVGHHFGLDEEDLRKAGYG
jgi:predicted Zn-dependent protease with MMP-like domain